MQIRFVSCLCVLVAVSASLGAAKDKNHLPLPPQVQTAKTIYIDNQSGIAKLGDRAYEQLNKWG